MSKKSTVLVTGGAGFIGSHLVRALIDEGCRVVSLDNYSTGHKDNHHAGAVYIDGHTKDIDTLVNETPDLVFHLGEYPRVEQSFADIATVLESNIRGTHAVLEFCRMRSAKIIYAGSSTKFADAGIGRDQSPYAWSKAVNTELVKNYGEWFGLPYAITYFYNVYGPGERSDSKTGTVVAIFAEQYRQGKALTVRAPGTQRRNFTHIFDIVEGLLRVGDRGEGDEYGLGHPESYAILDVAKLFSNDIEMLPERAGNRMTSKVDVHRAELELGWRPAHTLPDHIAELKRTK